MTVWWTRAVFLLLASTFLWAPNQAMCDTAEPTRAAVISIAKEVTSQAGTNGTAFERLLEEIGEQFPRLRSNYTMMYQSASRQEAWPEYPRVIAYSQSGEFVFTFNGHPDQRGYSDLEMMEFDHELDQFVFQRLTMTDDGELTVRQENEALCLRCHASPPRPNWESYEQWPGAYQEAHDRINGNKWLVEHGDRHAEFSRFMAGPAQTGRYRFLADLSERYGKQTDRFEGREANIELTQRLGRLNGKRIARLIFESSRYHETKQAIVAALYACQHLEQRLPPELRLPDRPSLNEIYRELRDELGKSDNFFVFSSPLHAKKLASLRWLEQHALIDMTAWSMSFLDSANSFATIRGHFDQFIFDHLAELDPSLAPYRIANVDLRPGTELYAHAYYTYAWSGNWDRDLEATCQALGF